MQLLRRIFVSSLLGWAASDAVFIQPHMRSVINVAVDCGVFKSCIACSLANTACKFVGNACVAGKARDGPTCANTVTSVPLQCNEKGGGYWLTIDDKRAICLSHTECGELARIGLTCDPYLRRKIKLSLPRLRAGKRPVTVRVNGRAIDTAKMLREGKKEERVTFDLPVKQSRKSQSRTSADRMASLNNRSKSMMANSKVSSGPQSQILPSAKISANSVAVETADSAVEIPAPQEVPAVANSSASKRGSSRGLLNSTENNNSSERRSNEIGESVISSDETPTRFSISEGGEPNRSRGDEDDIIRFPEESEAGNESISHKSSDNGLSSVHSTKNSVSSDSKGPVVESVHRSTESDAAVGNNASNISIKIRSKEEENDEASETEDELFDDMEDDDAASEDAAPAAGSDGETAGDSNKKASLDAGSAAADSNPKSAPASESVFQKLRSHIF